MARDVQGHFFLGLSGVLLALGASLLSWGRYRRRIVEAAHPGGQNPSRTATMPDDDPFDIR
jgi:hypothetical protein